MKAFVLQDLIADQAAQELGKKGRWAILPLGSTEYHGPRGPLGTDSDVAWKVGEKTAQAVGGILLPALHYGDSGFHKDFPGTIHVSPETLKRLILDISASLERQGVRKLLLLLGHWGNLDAALQARDEAARSGAGIRLEAARVFDPALLDRGSMDRLFGGSSWSGHGGAAEVSVALYSRPHASPPSPERVSEDFPPLPERDYSKLGWGGLPESASAELGERTIEIAAAAIIRRLRELDAE